MAIAIYVGRIEEVHAAIERVMQCAHRFVIVHLSPAAANGAGAKSRFDIGVVIAAGMAIGTMFTLFITPAIYSFLAKDRRNLAAEEEARLAGMENFVPANQRVAGAAADLSESGVTTTVMPGSTMAATAFLNASGVLNLCHSLAGTR